MTNIILLSFTVYLELGTFFVPAAGFAAFPRTAAADPHPSCGGGSLPYSRTMQRQSPLLPLPPDLPGTTRSLTVAAALSGYILISCNV